MRRSLFIICFLAALRFGIADEIQAVAQSRPNIVFILVDDMGWADGGCFGSGYYETPNIDRLASQGMQFTQAYASCAVCSPTRAAILTGKAPARLHITDFIPGEVPPSGARFQLPDWRKQLPEEETTIPEALKNLGYVTAHIGKWHLGNRQDHPSRHGFDVSIAGGHIGAPMSYWWPYGLTNAVRRVPNLVERGGNIGEYLTDRLTAEAHDFIARNRDRRFYLQLSHYAVHTPLMGIDKFVEAFRSRPGSRGQSNAVYAAMLKSVDESVGRILDQLDNLQLTDRTLVIFTSDNGGAVHVGSPPATSNRPLRNGKGTPYEGGLRVPLVIRAPWLTACVGVCDVPVISTDFFPTLLELAGAKTDAAATAMDGTSLVPLLKGKNESWTRSRLFWHYPHYWNRGAVSPYSVVRSGDWKLIRFYETGREELYNLGADPSELRDLASRKPSVSHRDKLSRLLDAWLDEVKAQRPQPEASVLPRRPKQRT